jgi:hypothetical protein
MPKARPALLPAGRWARVALGLLLAFALFRGLLFGLTVPPFWGPDEDYHYLYAQHLTTQGALPDPDRPLYPREYAAAQEAVDYGSYCCRTEGRFAGDPRRSLEELEGLPEATREPSEIGRGVGVVHPPLYQLPAAAVTEAASDASILTRLTWVRFLTACFGVLVVYAAWLLAAQVLTGFRLQLLTAFLVAVQPMVAYLAGIANHDSALIATATLVLAMCAFVLRSPPCVAQGAWLGGLLVLALFVKASALALLPVALLAYLGQWLAFRERGREVLRSAALAFGLVAVLAGWWYVRSRLAYGEATGYTTPVTGTGEGGPGASGGDLLDWAREWTGLTYRTYWFHYNVAEGPGQAIYRFVPAILGVLAMVGLARLGWRGRRRLFDADRPLLRQVVVLTAAALSFYIPVMAVDLMRRADGLPFFLQGGRYLLPAFAGVAVLFVVGIRALTPRRALPYALPALGLFALVFGTYVYLRFSLWHYLGEVPLGELLRRLTFNHPSFVTEGSVAVLLVLIAGSLAGLAYAAIRSPAGPATSRAPARPVSEPASA